MGWSGYCVMGEHQECRNFEDSCDCPHHLQSCVVVLKAGWTLIGGKTEYVEERCDKIPVVGERAGFPMCAEHYDLFDPQNAEE